MMPLRRHQLVWLNGAGWHRVLANARDTAAHGCIAQWAEQRWPLVVTRQTSPDQWRQGTLNLGLPASSRWGRMRLALAAEHNEIAYFGDFPEASAATKLLPRQERWGWSKLFNDLAEGGFRPRVYGSYGWQILTQQDHVRPSSDLDLLLMVSTPDEADHCTALLAAGATANAGVRLDGELMFGNGVALPWREWRAWRNGQVGSVIVKTTFSAELTHDEFWVPDQEQIAIGCVG